MPQENCQKIKLLKLMEILRQETDEDHPLKTSELCRKLVDMGISCDLRTLARDVKLLNRYGYEIMVRQQGRNKFYYVCDRGFSVPELKILIDAVQAASFVTDAKTTELIGKIANLGGSYRAALLRGNIVKFNTRKHSNESIYYTVGFLEEAIQYNLQVAFQYFDLDESGQRILRKNGDKYIVEPIALVFSEDNYYLITYNQKYESTTNYRVDRICNIEVLYEPISDIAKSLRLEIGKYTEATFKMFNGELEDVTLQFDDKLIGAVYDKFGEDTEMKRVGEHTIEAAVQVRIAPTFWGWVSQFPGQMKIVAPDEVIEQYKAHLRKEVEMLGGI